MVPEAILKVSKLSPHNRMEYKRHLSTSPQNIEIHKGKLNKKGNHTGINFGKTNLEIELEELHWTPTYPRDGQSYHYIQLQDIVSLPDLKRLQSSIANSREKK